MVPYPMHVVNCLTSSLCRRQLFYGEGLSKNVGHHGWPTTKNFKITLAKMP